MLEDLVGEDPAAGRELLTEARGQAVDALSTLRDLARGIYPAALTDSGVVAALQGHLAKSHGAVSLEVDADVTSARFPRDLEAAVYFCILEALQNCAKHAPGAAVHFALARPDTDWLTFSVRDDERGFDPAAVQAGTGQQHMADRLAAMDDTLARELGARPGNNAQWPRADRPSR